MCCQDLVKPHFGEGLEEPRRAKNRSLLDVLLACVCLDNS